jgi:hypothetical protein
MGDLSGLGTGVSSAARMAALDVPRMKADIVGVMAGAEKAAREGEAAGAMQKKLEQDAVESRARTAMTLKLTDPSVLEKQALIDLARANTELSNSSAKKNAAELPPLQLRSNFGSMGDLFGLIRKYMAEGSGSPPGGNSAK